MLKKRGLSDVVTTLIIVLLVLVAIGIIWVVVNNVIKSGSEQIELGQYTLDLQIKSAQVEDGNVILVVVRRNPGQGEFVGMNFVFSDGQNSETIRENVSLVEGGTKSFTFTLTEISTSALKSVSVYPIYKLSSGKETTGNVADSFDVPANKSTAGTGEVTISNFAALGFTNAGMKEYTFSSQSTDVVKFTKAIVDPLDVLPGDNQTFTAIVYSPNGITTVTSITELDNNILNLDFEKISDDGAGTSTWSVSWIVNDTHTIEYRTNITATDSRGNSGSVTLTWTDSCQSQITHGGDDTLSTSCTTGVSGVDGIDGGSLTIAAGVTLTIDSGSTFIFNQGKSITITAAGARIVSTSGGSFGNGFLYYPDSDGDGAAVSSTLSYSTTSPTLLGKVRAQNNPSTTDCNDGSEFIWYNGYGTDSDGDGYGTSSFGCNNGASTRTATLGTDCNDSSATAQTNKAAFSDGDGDAYTVSAGTLCLSSATWATSACNTAGTSYSKNSAGGCQLISSLSGTDCCDSDANAKPGQTSFFTTARTTCGGFDYDCSGGETSQLTGSGGACTDNLWPDPSPNGPCTGLADTGDPVCGCTTGGVVGWSGAGEAACGASGTYVSTTSSCSGFDGCPVTTTQACR